MCNKKGTYLLKSAPLPILFKVSFSINIVIFNAGWMNRDVMAEWAEKCYRGRPNAFFNKTAMLVLHSMTAHKDEHIRNVFKTQHDTILGVIPGGLTKKLQPLDITVNRVFKLHIRVGSVDDGGPSYLHGDVEDAASHHAEVCNWVLSAWKAVKPSTIINGFIKAKIISGDEEESDEDSAELDAEMAALFNSDSEGSDFEGFE